MPMSMTLASPDERCRMAIPARHGIVGVLALQGPSLDDALHRPHHVELGGGTRGREQEDAVLSTPLHEVAATMTR